MVYEPPASCARVNSTIGRPPASCARVNSTVPPAVPIDVSVALPATVPVVMVPARPVTAAIRAPAPPPGPKVAFAFEHAKAKAKEADEDLWGAALGYLMTALGLGMAQETADGSLELHAGRSGAVIGRSQSAPELGSDDNLPRNAARSAQRPERERVLY